MGKREMVWKWKSIGGVVKIDFGFGILILGILKQDKVTRYKKIK